MRKLQPGRKKSDGKVVPFIFSCVESLCVLKVFLKVEAQVKIQKWGKNKFQKWFGWNGRKISEALPSSRG